MSCEICGRSSCTRSFHSREEQDGFDDVADSVKDRMRNRLIYKIRRLDCIEGGDNGDDYVKLDDVISEIEFYD